MFSPEAVKRRCNGMLPSSVYQRIHDTAAAARITTFVEVGTAHAAATVSMALGLKDSGRAGRIYTFERGKGGSRVEYGGVDENTRIIRANLEHFGVSDIVELLVGDVSDLSSRVPADGEIGLLMLDADGRIDRDISLFYDRVVKGGPVIIDDVVDEVRLYRTRGGRYAIDQKLKIAHRLLEVMIKSGLLSSGQIVSETYFGEKLDKASLDVPPEAVLNAYRGLIFSEAAITKPNLKAILLPLAEFLSPRAVDAYRKRKRAGQDHSNPRDSA